MSNNHFFRIKLGSLEYISYICSRIGSPLGANRAIYFYDIDVFFASV